MESRPRMEVGSPCEPVHISTTSLSGMFSAWSRRTSRFFGDIQVAQLAGHLGVIDHAGADKGHLAAVALRRHWPPAACARSARRKLAMMMRPGGFAEDLLEAPHRSPARRASSRGARRWSNRPAAPARRAAKTRPAWRNRSASYPPGCGRTCNRRSGRSARPGFRCPARPPSGMEWQTWKNSTLKGPICTASPAWTVCRSAFGRQPVAGQLDFQQAAGQRGGVDRRLDFLQHVVDRADVVFVTVGDDDAAHLVAVLSADR